MNPPYAFDRPQGGGGMAYMATVNKRQHIGGMAKIWETNNSTAINQSQGLYVLVKEAVVPKEFESSKEDRTQPQARRAAATDGHGKTGVFHPTEVAHRVFPSPISSRVFFLSIYKFPLCTEQSAQAVQDPYQTLIKELTTTTTTTISLNNILINNL